VGGEPRVGTVVLVKNAQAAEDEDDGEDKANSSDGMWEKCGRRDTVCVCV
jgi:hypothetical protein